MNHADPEDPGTRSAAGGACPSAGTERRLRVEARDGGTRIDAFLAERLAVSRAEARRWLAEGAVRLAGRVLGAHHKGRRLAAGAELSVHVRPPREALRPLPEPERPLRILARGAGWLALDKPPGMPVHPLHPEERGTLLNALIARHPEVWGVGEGGLRSGVVHRLDVETSGAVLFALDRASHARLRAAFGEARIGKRYRALVRGAVAGDGAIELWLEVAAHRPARVRVAREAGARARPTALRWRVAERLPGATLLEVEPRTGFLHQIRATLAHLGHPVLGDPRYGDPETDPLAVPRQMLHAAWLKLQEIEAQSPDPPDFVTALAALRGRA